MRASAEQAKSMSEAMSPSECGGESILERIGYATFLSAAETGLTTRLRTLLARIGDRLSAE